MTQFFSVLRAIDVWQVVRACVDIAVVSYFLYRLILLAKGRRAWWILIGLGVFFLLILVSDVLGLVTLNWLLKQVTPLGPVAIVVLFYPELREVLEKLGRAEFWGTSLHVADRGMSVETIEEVTRAVGILSPLKIGALIVFERETGLDDILTSGVVLDAEVSTPLLVTLFHKDTPLHDGAVVIRGDRIAAAQCYLHLSDSPNIAPNVHTRHRAAIGQSEVSDAVIVVVSEETGTISIATGGKLQRGLKTDVLRTRLLEAYGKSPTRKGRRRTAMGLTLGRLRPNQNGTANANGATTASGTGTSNTPAGTASTNTGVVSGTGTAP